MEHETHFGELCHWNTFARVAGWQTDNWISGVQLDYWDDDEDADRSILNRPGFLCLT